MTLRALQSLEGRDSSSRKCQALASGDTAPWRKAAPEKTASRLGDESWCCSPLPVTGGTPDHHCAPRPGLAPHAAHVRNTPTFWLPAPSLNSGWRKAAVNPGLPSQEGRRGSRPGTRPPAPARAGPHLRLQEAAVGRVGCAASLPLLPLALDFCKGTDAAVTGCFLPWAPPPPPASWPLRQHGMAPTPAAAPGGSGPPAIMHSEAGPMGRRAVGTGIQVPALGTGLCVPSSSPRPRGQQMPDGQTLAWLRSSEAPGPWGSLGCSGSLCPTRLHTDPSMTTA